MLIERLCNASTAEYAGENWTVFSDFSFERKTSAGVPGNDAFLRSVRGTRQKYGASVPLLRRLSTD